MRDPNLVKFKHFNSKNNKKCFELFEKCDMFFQTPHLRFNDTSYRDVAVVFFEDVVYIIKEIYFKNNIEDKRLTLLNEFNLPSRGKLIHFNDYYMLTYRITFGRNYQYSLIPLNVDDNIVNELKLRRNMLILEKTLDNI